MRMVALVPLASILLAVCPGCGNSQEKNTEQAREKSSNASAAEAVDKEILELRKVATKTYKKGLFPLALEEVKASHIMIWIRANPDEVLVEWTAKRNIQMIYLPKADLEKLYDALLSAYRTKAIAQKKLLKELNAEEKKACDEAFIKDFEPPQ